ncbi:MAG TPA: hypothetical protein VFJ85_11470 [Acidimicrobiales bacterium]|nr:hypothetical protein [Acidimicrobiales bacterium]
MGIAFVTKRTTLQRATLEADARVEHLTAVHVGTAVTSPSFSPDGRSIVFEDGFSVWKTAVDGSEARTVSPPDARWTCPAWAPDSSAIVVTRRVRPGSWVLSHVELATGRTTDLLSPGPWRSTPCGAYLDAGHLLLTQRDPATHSVGIFMAGVDGLNVVPFVFLHGCNVTSPRPDPTGTQVLVAASCIDPYDDGAWAVPVAGGAPRHVLTGHVAVPVWTPGGAILFGYIALGATQDRPSLWVAAADGSEPTTVLGLPGTWNSWPAAG